MDLTRKQVIKNLNALNAVCGQKDFYDKEMKESMRYAISSLETDETYQLMHEGGEIFTKADLVAILTEIQLEIKELPPHREYITGYDNAGNKCTYGYKEYPPLAEDVNEIIQEKINKLKGEK